MKKFPAWLTYTILRLLMIVVPLAILLLAFGKKDWPVWTIASVFIGFALSYIFLKRPRQRMAQQLVDVRARGRVSTVDDDVEDAAVDAASAAPRNTDPDPDDED